MGKDKFTDLLDTALAGDTGLSSMLNGMTAAAPAAPERPAKPKAPAAHKAASVEQRRAVDKARNEQRGRGKSKGARRMIAFQVPEETVASLEDLCYAMGRTKNDLYNEALDSLLKKYSKYLND
jgi:hypothetical protein